MGGINLWNYCKKQIPRSSTKLFLLINSEVPVLEVWFYVSPSSSLSFDYLKFGITDLANKVRDLTPGSMDSVCKMPYIANNNVPLYFFMTLRIR